MKNIAIYALLFLLSSMSLRIESAEIKKSQGVLDADGETVWYDGTLLAIEGKGWVNTESYYDRLPATVEGKVTKSVWGLSHNSAGMNLRFMTDATSIKVQWVLRSHDLAMPHMAATGVSGIDLYGKQKNGSYLFLKNGLPKADSNLVIFKVKPASEYILYLPLYNSLNSIKIGLPKEAYLQRPDKEVSRLNKTIVFYGTSITQGGCASRPGTAFTNIVGRRLDAPVINLGFSGSGKMEMEMADLLTELNPAVYVLDCLWNMSPQMINERFAPFIRKLRAKKPNTPIVLAEDSNVYDISPTVKGKIAHALYEKLRKEGMNGLYYLSNKGMLGADGEGTVDGCHPTDLGMMRMADVFSKFLEPILP